MKKNNYLYTFLLTAILISILVVALLIIFAKDYKFFRGKIVYIHFVVQDNNAIKDSDVKIDCEVIDDNSCSITVPEFNVSDGYTLLGWNTNKDELTPSIRTGDKIDIKNSIVYYSITKRSEPLKGNFIVQNNTATKSDNVSSCELYNGQTSCSIEVPVLTANDNNTVIGWNTDKDAITKMLDGGETLEINSDITYYSITKSNKQLTATFDVQTPSLVSASTTTASCELYNGNNSCDIKTPLLNKLQDNVNMMGWNIDKEATSPSVNGDTVISLNQDETFYSIVSQKITVTFEIGDNVSGKNIKAEKLSFNYIDANGNTVIKEEGQRLSTTCISYNGKGCKINILPTIYSRGNYVHGFSRTNGGKNMAALTTVYKEDTTLYTRVGYYNTIGINSVNISYQKIYGNVIFEIENGVSENYKNKVNALLDKLYKYYPELFYFNGKIFLFTRNTYNSVLKASYPNINESAGYTIMATNYNNAYFYGSGDDYLFTMTHELGHAFDQSYSYSFIKTASEMDEIISLYNKYKSQSSRPLRSYSYTNIYEFVADSFSNTMRMLLYQKEGNYPYSNEGRLPDDIKNTIVKYINQRKDYLTKNGFMK